MCDADHKYAPKLMGTSFIEKCFPTDSIDEWMSWIVHSGLDTGIECDSVLGLLVLEFVEHFWSETSGHPVVMFPQVWEVWDVEVGIAVPTARNMNQVIYCNRKKNS